MSFSSKKLSRKTKTESDNCDSLPRLKTSDTINLSLMRKSKAIFSSFPEKFQNPELLLKKASINLDMVKKMSSTTCDYDQTHFRRILPHHITAKKQFTQMTGLKKQKQTVLSVDNLLHITAQRWLIFDCQKQQVVKGFKSKQQHDVASLSKLVTFYTAFMIIKQYRLSIDKLELIVLKEDQQINGSRIQLKNDSVVLLEDMLYAMMLNSANNAATVIANNLGYFCLIQKQKRYFSCYDVNSQNRRNNINHFVHLMESFVNKLELKQTKIVNPHGMANNISTARDIAVLFQSCWKIPLFKNIIQTRQRKMEQKYINFQGKLINQQIILKNSNKMPSYYKDCLAGKTGQNKFGGNSFVGCFQDEQLNRFLIIVLGSFGRQERYRDVEKLYQWLKSSKN